MRRVAVVLACMLGLSGAGVLLATPASAHATLVTSSPADGARLHTAPKQVTLTFDENVGLGGIGYLHVTDQTGKRVDAGTAGHPGGDGTKVTDPLVSGLGNGSYTASWRVISADSHVVAGTVSFVVGSGALVRAHISTATTDHTTTSTFDVIRWISYAGLALLGGAWLLLTVWPEGRDDRRARGLVWAGWGAAVLGALGELLIEGPYAAGDAPWRIASFVDDTLHTHYGQLHCLRLVLLGVLALVFARALQADARPARWEGAAGLLAVGVAYTFSAAGHPDTTDLSWLSVLADMLHVLAMMTWLGGLIMLVGAVLPRREPGELRAVLPVFSTAAFAAVSTLAATGTYAAFRGIGTVNAIFTTTYGLLVVAKIALFLGLLALGNVSRRVVQRRFAAPRVAYAMTDDILVTVAEPAAGEGASDDQADAGADPPDHETAVDTERLRRAVLVEAGVGLIVLALTAVLVSQPRGKEALVASYRNPSTVSAALGSGRNAAVTADPGTHGAVTITVTLPAGVPASQVTATATQHAKQLGPIPIKLAKDGAHGWTGTAGLPVAGAWEIDIVVASGPFDATTTNATVHLH